MKVCYKKIEQAEENTKFVKLFMNKCTHLCFKKYNRLTLEE